MVQKERAKFRYGNTLSNGRVIKSKGGGYCQVSTALYNAALLAGLEVQERYAHSFYDEAEAYVEPGRDAAVSSEGHADFRFVNSHASAVTLQAQAMGGKVAVQILGRGPRRIRWISTEAKRLPAPSRPAPAGAGPRKGHDGWEVRRSLNYLDSRGQTRTSSLGMDRYDTVPEWTGAAQ
jgi:vancomycin resistance protein YoaR